MLPSSKNTSLQSADALARLLQHPAIWRGRSVARTAVIPTGFAALDERLPGHGWPRSGLVEILLPRLGIGELYLVLPALSALTREPAARWSVWTAPPFRPFAPALAAHGVRLERLMLVNTAGPWAFEQSLNSGDCDTVLGWSQSMSAKTIRRWQLAAEQGRSLGLWFRKRTDARESSSATLRLSLDPLPHGVKIDIVKSRGGLHGAFNLYWPAGTLE